MQSATARDEHHHAELAWSILQWALARGGEDARSAVAAAREAYFEPGSDAVPQEGLEAHGRLSSETAQALAAQHFEASQQRLNGLLARR